MAAAAVAEALPCPWLAWHPASAAAQGDSMDSPPQSPAPPAPPPPGDAATLQDKLCTVFEAVLGRLGPHSVCMLQARASAGILSGASHAPPPRPRAAAARRRRHR